MPNMLLEKSGEISLERMKRLSQVKTVVNGTSDASKPKAVKNNIT